MISTTKYRDRNGSMCHFGGEHNVWSPASPNTCRNDTQRISIHHSNNSIFLNSHRHRTPRTDLDASGHVVASCVQTALQKESRLRTREGSGDPSNGSAIVVPGNNSSDSSLLLQQCARPGRNAACLRAVQRRTIVSCGGAQQRRRARWRARWRRSMDALLVTFGVAVLGCLMVMEGAVGLVIEEPFQEIFQHVPATFGPDVLSLDPPITSRPLVSARPRDACVPLYNSAQMEDGVVALVERGKCNFTEKIIHAQRAGASAVVVTDHAQTDNWFMAMSGSPENTQDVQIPAVFVSHETGERLWSKRLRLSSGKIRASVNATGHVFLRPRSIGVLETLGVYILVSMLLVGFSGICGVLFAFGVSWYQRYCRKRALRRLRTFTFRRPVRRQTAAAGTDWTMVRSQPRAQASGGGGRIVDSAEGRSSSRRLAVGLRHALASLCRRERGTPSPGGPAGVIAKTAADPRCAERDGSNGVAGGGSRGGAEEDRAQGGVVSIDGSGGQECSEGSEREAVPVPAAPVGDGARSAQAPDQDGAGNDSHGMRAEDDTCAICLDMYDNGDTLTALPCRHFFHAHCIRPWLSGNGVCPICKAEAFAPTGRKAFSTFVSSAGTRLEVALAELTELCTDNLFMLGVFFVASVVCGVVAAEYSVRGGA